VSVQSINNLKAIEANHAYAFFVQSMAICRPYMDEKQAQTLGSRFAGIRGRSDYVNVINDLRKIAASNRQRLPDFKPW
jgi:hypothetical protein